MRTDISVFTSALVKVQPFGLSPVILVQFYKPGASLTERDPDAALMARIARGESGAVQSLVEIFLSRIFRFANRIVQDTAEAEEISQEVMLRAFRHAERWEPGKTRLNTWLHTVALNLCRDSLRRRARQRTTVTDLRDVADPSLDLESRLLETERAVSVSSAIHALPERQRNAVLIVHYQDLSGAEAALVLGVSVEALESLLSRACRRLRQNILRQEPDDD